MAATPFDSCVGARILTQPAQAIYTVLPNNVALLAFQFLGVLAITRADVGRFWTGFVAPLRTAWERARAEKAATVALDTEPPAPPANVLGEDAPARMFQSALAQVVSTVQRRGQMISKFIAKLANIFSDIDSVNDGSISTGTLS